MKKEYHWMSGTRFNKIFKDMCSRCKNENDTAYKYYWWRWIKCLRETFKEFRDDMYESYLAHIKELWEKETTIDRINSDWNYCNENCRWATKTEQMNNRKNCHILEHNHNKLTLAQWARKLWYKYSELYHAICTKWLDIETIIKSWLHKNFTRHPDNFKTF